MKNRNESLAKNTVIFAVGSFGSKLLQFILVPFYTRAMTDAEFGVTDLLQGAVSLLLPIFTLTIYESVFRYAMEKETDRKGVFSAGVAVTVAGIGFLAVIAAALTFFTTIEYVPLVAALTAAELKKDVDKLILFFPAFCIRERCRNREITFLTCVFHPPEHVPVILRAVHGVFRMQSYHECLIGFRAPCACHRLSVHRDHGLFPVINQSVLIALAAEPEAS